MRVIAGTFRSRILQAPAGTATRPTSDRLRETLFNILGPRTVGARFADLYAGSGAVGVEALSRGATDVLFAETHRPAIESIRRNLTALGITAGFTLKTSGTAAALQSPAATFDIVFLDPPYEAADEYTRTLTTLGTASLLSPNALVIAEHSRKTPLSESYGHLTRTRTLQQGDAALSFFTPAGEKVFRAATINLHEA